MCQGCLFEINEDTVEDIRGRDAELHILMPITSNRRAATPVRRDQLAEELLHPYPGKLINWRSSPRYYFDIFNSIAFYKCFLQMSL